MSKKKPHDFKTYDRDEDDRSVRERLERMAQILLGWYDWQTEIMSNDDLLHFVEEEYEERKNVHSKVWLKEMKEMLDNIRDDIAEEEFLK